MKASLKARYEADKPSAAATVVFNASDINLRASMTDATVANGPNLNGLSIAVEKPGFFIIDYNVPKKDVRFQFMNTIRISDKPLNLTYTHFRGENMTILDGTFVFDSANKISANHVLGSENCKLKYSYTHDGATTFEPSYDWAKNSWDFAVSRRVYGDDVFRASYQTSSKNLGLDWSRNSKSFGGFKSQEYGSAERRGVKAKDSSDELDDEIRGEDRVDARRALEFDDVADSENLGTNQLAEEDKIVEKKINKRVKNDGAKGSKPGKRKLEKERKNYLTQLHAESQRLLRETTNAAFKHTPVVGKSISDVLEKIRERKMLVTKNTTTMMPYNNVSASSNIMSSLRDDIEVKERESNGVVKSVDQLPHMTAEKDEISSKGHQLNADCLELDGSTKSATPSGCENRPIQKDPDEESIPPIFRAPIGGRQGILEDSDTKENEVESQSDHADIPFEEAFVPSPPASIIRFDQDLSDYSSSEEGNDKENVPPLSQRSEDSSLRGDPVKAFLDEEAEEEDDSDHDMLRFPENEDDMGDSEELNDIIATDYEERPVDNERRNELHQKWLERQDAAGTDNLLQKLKFGVHQQETAAICQEEEYDDKEEYSAEDEDDPPPKCATRVNMRKARQMITEMFDEKDEIFLSDEDEESEKIFFKHRHIVRTEEQEVSVSSVQDESSKEVFGLIKKLNIGPVSRKKARVSSYFDSMLKVENGNSFSKSSFAGRFSNHPLPSCHRKSSGSARSFIFGRDDSNSQNSILASDESEDSISKGNKPIRTSRAPPTSSQGKFSSQNKYGSAETSSHTSLLDILKRSSIKSGFCNREDRLDLTQVISTFKIPK